MVELSITRAELDAIIVRDSVKIEGLDLSQNWSSKEQLAERLTNIEMVDFPNVLATELTTVAARCMMKGDDWFVKLCGFVIGDGLLAEEEGGGIHRDQSTPCKLFNQLRTLVGGLSVKGIGATYLML